MVQGLPIATPTSVAAQLEQVRLAETENARSTDSKGDEKESSPPASPVRQERPPSPASSVYTDASDRQSEAGPSSREDVGASNSNPPFGAFIANAQFGAGPSSRNDFEPGNFNSRPGTSSGEAMETDTARKEEKTSFLPAFVDFDDAPVTKQGTKTQVSSLQQLECDSEDASITARLQNGCRPGEFMRLTMRLNEIIRQLGFFNKV